MNTYEYVFSNPVFWSDPYGLRVKPHPNGINRVPRAIQNQRALIALGVIGTLLTYGALGPQYAALLDFAFIAGSGGEPPFGRGAGCRTRAFHHTADELVESITRKGLRPGSYATPTDNLSPLQAKVELALPGNWPRNAVLEIDLAGLRNAGYEIPEVTRVSSYKRLPGGGYEMQFPYAIPPRYLSVIQP